MASFPINSIPVEFDDQYYELTGNMLVINVSNEFNESETMKRYLVSLVFKVYIEVNGEYIYIDKSTVTWDEKTDKAIIIDFPYPDGSLVAVNTIVDNSIFNLVDLKGNLLYPDAKEITEFPITITNE